MIKIQRKLLTIFFLASNVALGQTRGLNDWAAANSTCITVVGTVTPGCRCYGPADLAKIADAVVDLQKCQLELGEKNQLVLERLAAPQVGASPHFSFWQEPSVIVGGIVISAGVASFATYWLLKSSELP